MAPSGAGRALDPYIARASRRFSTRCRNAERERIMAQLFGSSYQRHVFRERDAVVLVFEDLRIEARPCRERLPVRLLGDGQVVKPLQSLPRPSLKPWRADPFDAWYQKFDARRHGLLGCEA